MKPEKEERAMDEYQLYSIGVVDKTAGQVTLRIRPGYRKSLQGLDGYSHVWVFFWFHKNDTSQKRTTLQVHPRGNRDNPLTGVFACRSPARPNLIGMSLCRIQAVKDDLVVIDEIDAFDQTPFLDLKPYVSRIDAPSGAVRQPPWVSP